MIVKDLKLKIVLHVPVQSGSWMMVRPLVLISACVSWRPIGVECPSPQVQLSICEGEAHLTCLIVKLKGIFQDFNGNRDLSPLYLWFEGASYRLFVESRGSSMQILWSPFSRVDLSEIDGKPATQGLHLALLEIGGERFPLILWKMGSPIRILWFTCSRGWFF